MKVLHILNSMEYSGAENVVCTIMKNMRQGDECLYFSRDGSIRQKLGEQGLPFAGTDRLDGAAIKRVVGDFCPDIIHAHDFTASILASVKCGNIPVISHLHNNRPWMKSVNPRTLLYASTFRRYAAVLQVSESVGDEYVFSKRQGSRMITVGNPFSAESVRMLAESGGEAGACDVLFVGRLTEQKNLPCFIETIEIAARERPDIKAVIIGNGEDDKLCRDLIKQKKLENNIEMKGYSRNPYPWMQRAKLLLMPSRYEGFGLVALEAMSLGVPVLACPVGGLAQIVTPECGALLHTPEEFSARILSLLDDDAAYAEKSRAALARAKEYDNVDRYMGKLYSIYEKTLKKCII